MAVQPDTHKLPGPIGAGTSVALFIAFYVLLPPWNTIYVFSGVVLGVVMFAAFIFGFRMRPTWAWWFAFAVLVAEQFATVIFFPVEGFSPSAGFAHHAVLALTTLTVLIALFGRQILQRSGRPDAT